MKARAHARAAAVGALEIDLAVYYRVVTELSVTRHALGSSSASATARGRSCRTTSSCDDPFDAGEDDRIAAEVAYGNPLYHPQHLNFFHGEIGAIMSCVAAAAVDEYERITLAKRTYDPLPPGPRRAAPDDQRPLGIGPA